MRMSRATGRFELRPAVQAPTGACAVAATRVCLADQPRRLSRLMRLTSIEICAGGGGQALGLEQAGFEHLALVEIDAHARATLRANRPGWHVDPTGDVTTFDATPYKGEVTLVAGGVP